MAAYREYALVIPGGSSRPGHLIFGLSLTHLRSQSYSGEKKKEKKENKGK